MPPFDFTQNMPQAAQPFDYMKLFNIGGQNQPSMDVPYSPQTDVLGGGSQVGGMTQPGWQNPYQWQSWGDSKGIGDFFGANAKIFGAGFDMLSKGVGAYTGIKQLGLASDALALEKKRFNTNLANQVKSYNTQMGDRIAGRSYATEAERQAALAAAQLPDPTQKKKGG